MSECPTHLSHPHLGLALPDGDTAHPSPRPSSLHGFMQARYSLQPKTTHSLKHAAAAGRCRRWALMSVFASWPVILRTVTCSCLFAWTIDAHQSRVQAQHEVYGCSTSYSSPAAVRSMDPRGSGSSSTGGPQFNAAYAAIFGIYGLLFLFKNPYIYAALSILTIIPQNSAITSLNSLVILFYESGLFMNFAEAVYCVRLMTWLSVACTLISFAVFA